MFAGLTLAAVGSWLKANIVPILTLALVAFAGLMLALHFLKGTAVETTKATLATSQASAANASGVDAVSTVEHDTEHDTTIYKDVTNGQSAVNAATDAADADAVGRDSLCRLASDYCPASAVQQPGSH